MKTIKHFIFRGSCRLSFEYYNQIKGSKKPVKKNKKTKGTDYTKDAKIMVGDLLDSFK
jgi:hypothetical protein